MSAPLSLALAAQLLGTTRNSLLRRLNEDGHMRGTTPCADLLKQRVFVLEARQTTINNGITRHYQVTLVTIQGLAWLDQCLNSHKLREVS